MESRQFAVIVENDVTKWRDQSGVAYHYPRRYQRYLAPGTSIIHYKGRMIDKSFRANRLSQHPHYFAVSVAGQSRPDPNSEKGDLYVDILSFKMFDSPVLYKDAEGQTREEIPETRKGNFWRDGVRPASQRVFERILTAAGLAADRVIEHEPKEEEYFTSSVIEGGEKRVWTTRYERSGPLRESAIRLHGTTCFACEADLGKAYGPMVNGFIHIHHKRPISRTGKTVVNPATDLVPLCPTCHAIVHFSGKLNTVNQVRAMLGKDPIPLGD